MSEHLDMVRDAVAKSAAQHPGLQWNKVTWYSWALAVIVFVLVIPGVAFYIGTQYQLTKQTEAVAISQGADLSAIVPGAPKPTTTAQVAPKKQTRVVKPAPTACTTETKLCADGSAVSRIAPTCEFAKCPSSTGRPTLAGRAMIGPTCPVERIPPDPSCADKPYGEQSLEVWTKDQSGFVKSFKTKLDGTFETELTPGAYIIRLPKTSPALPALAPLAFSVEQGKVTEVTLSLDTGIR